MNDYIRTEERSLEVIKPLERAWGHMKKMLFPFNFGLWIRLGFVTWLSMLGRGGFSFNFPQGKGGPLGGAGGAEGFIKRVITYVEGNMNMILLVGAAGLVIVFGIIAGLQYLRARGVFMYLDAVYRRQCKIKEGWRLAGKPAWSYFLWQLVLSAVQMFVGVGLAVVVICASWPAMRAGELRQLPWGILVLASGVLVILFMLIGIVRWLLGSFVAPIMYVRGFTCMEAWREMSALFSGHIGAVFLFLLMSILLGMAGSTIIMLVTCMTCCLGALPVVLQTLAQPYFLCMRAYGPYFLAQFGEPYEIKQTGEYESELDGDAGEAAVSAQMVEGESHAVICPHCGAEQRVPVNAEGAYECSECGGGFVAR